MSADAGRSLHPALRYALPALLLLSWVVAVAMMWRGLTTIPSAERLAESHMVRIPTPGSFMLQVGVSIVELAVLIALTWPGRAPVARLWAAALGTLAWFFATTPLGINTVQWAHRRWLAGVALWLLLTAVILTARALLRRLRGRPPFPPDPT